MFRQSVVLGNSSTSLASESLDSLLPPLVELCFWVILNASGTAHIQPRAASIAAHQASQLLVFTAHPYTAHFSHLSLSCSGVSMTPVT